MLEVKVQEVVEPSVLTRKRTEYGKAIRKDYDSGRVKEKRGNMTKWESREDGIANTLTSVQKDNMLCGLLHLTSKTSVCEWTGPWGL